jgi:hypothetical protein
LDLGAFRVKINHRGLLDAILVICGVPPDKFRQATSPQLRSLQWCFQWHVHVSSSMSVTRDASNFSKQRARRSNLFWPS